jgi:ribosomal protein S18 acetylase RimI-like enzyme
MCFVEEYDPPWTSQNFEDLWQMAGRKAEKVRVLCAVHTVEQIIVGMAAVLETPDSLEILTLAVAPHFARLGVATLLLEDIMKHSPQLRCFLEVAATNAPAYSLYKKIGFTEVGRRRKYYTSLAGGKAVDAIVMRRQT